MQVKFESPLAFAYGCWLLWFSSELRKTFYHYRSKFKPFALSAPVELESELPPALLVPVELESELLLLQNV